MKKTLTSGLVLAMVIIFGVGSVMAADRKRDKKRDGTCKSSYTTESTDQTLAATKKRDKKRDRSCLSYINAADDEALTLAATKKRDKKRDGSCLS
jgi:hypothetical protein